MKCDTKPKNDSEFAAFILFISKPLSLNKSVSATDSSLLLRHKQKCKIKFQSLFADELIYRLANAPSPHTLGASNVLGGSDSELVGKLGSI